MPLLATEAAKLSIEDRQRGIVEEVIDRDELFALFPFVGVADETYSYNRELVVAQGAWIDPYETLEESASTFTPVSTKLKRLAGQVDIDNFMDEVQSTLNNQTAVQLALKAKGMGRQFRSELVNGDIAVNAKGFDGVRKLATGPQTIFGGTNGGPVSFALLDELSDLIKNGCDMLMMRQGTWRAIRALNRAMGANSAETIMVENFGQPIKAYDGIPVIINDYLPVNEVRGSSSVCTSIYAMRLNEVDGVHGLFGGAAAGFRLEKVGLLQGQDATRWRMKWYAGLALKSTQSLARLAGITNI